MKDVKLIIVGCLVVLFCLFGALAGYPVYNVWQQGMSGQAMLKKAEQEKQIMIEQARAEVEASKLRAQAIEAVGEAVQKYPEYRLQEFIGAFGDAMANGDIEKIIYVPTEANIPIVEAGRAVAK